MYMAFVTLTCPPTIEGWEWESEDWLDGILVLAIDFPRKIRSLLILAYSPTVHGTKVRQRGVKEGLCVCAFINDDANSAKEQ